MMWYMGGKFRQSKAITIELVQRYQGEKTYVEPFCGALGAAEKVIPQLAELGVTEFRLSDSSDALVTMWNAVLQRKWVPPESVTESTYKHVKATRNSEDPMTAYCGFAMSFGGKWFGGLARSGVGTERTQMNQRAATLRKADAIRPFCKQIQAVGYHSLDFNGCIAYLDPPYANRTKAHDFGNFDSGQFWQWAELQAKKNNVVVTAFEAPVNWRAVYSWGDTVVRHHKGGASDGTNESIYVLGGK